MKHYQLDSIFAFGIHAGKSLLTVCLEDEEYINWCQANLDHFYLPDEVIAQLHNANPDFSLSLDAIKKRNDNYDKWIEQEVEFEEMQSNYEPEDDYGTSTEKYGGYNGWSDDAIDDAFEGDPENTWNVD